MWKSSSIRVYFATPELVKNDIRDNIIKKDEFYLIIFDEAQRAVKDYSYTSISKQFYNNSDHGKHPLVLGLSASPGAKEEKIKEICTNLFIEQIIAKSERDDDVLPYVFDTNIEHYSIEMNDYHKDLSALLNSLINDNINWLINNRFIRKRKVESVYRKDLLSLGDYIKSKLDPKNMNFFLLTALKFQSLSLILLYCRDLVESQGSFALKKFLDNAKDNSESKTYQELFLDSRIKAIIQILKDHNNEPPPKLIKVLSVVSQFLDLRGDIKTSKNSSWDTDNVITKQGDSDYKDYEDKRIPTNYQKKILIFSQYRDTLEEITNFSKLQWYTLSGDFTVNHIKMDRKASVRINNYLFLMILDWENSRYLLLRQLQRRVLTSPMLILYYFMNLFQAKLGLYKGKEGRADFPMERWSF